MASTQALPFQLGATKANVFSPVKPTWVVSDMDGTFLDDHHNLSDENVEAYKRLQKAGVPVIPATGRSLYALKTVLNAKRPDLEFDYYPGLYCNGSVAYGESPDAPIYHAKLGTHVIKAFTEACYTWFDGELKAARDTNMSLFLQHVDGALLDFRTDFYTHFEQEWFEEPSDCMNRRFDESVWSLPYKFVQCTVFVSDARMTSLLEHIRSDEAVTQLIETGEMRCFPSTVMEINCVSASDDKAKGIETLIKHFNFDRNTLMTIGDGQNDLGMLKLAPFSVAMGQSGPLVKSAAKFETLPTSEAGWSDAMSKMILNK